MDIIFTTARINTQTLEHQSAPTWTIFRTLLYQFSLFTTIARVDVRRRTFWRGILWEHNWTLTLKLEFYIQTIQQYRVQSCWMDGRGGLGLQTGRVFLITGGPFSTATGLLISSVASYFIWGGGGGARFPNVPTENKITLRYKRERANTSQKYVHVSKYLLHLHKKNGMTL